MQELQVNAALRFVQGIVPALSTKFIVSKRNFNELFPWTTLEDLAKILTEQESDADWYYTPSSFVAQVGGFVVDEVPTRASRNAQFVQSFWVDLDVGTTDDKYPTQRAAVAALGDWCEAAALPAPTVTVSSGVGIQAYWTLQEPIAAILWTETAFKFKALARHHGLKADPSRTADCASLMRLVGTLNTKATNVTEEGRVNEYPYALQIAEREEPLHFAFLLNAIDVAYELIKDTVPEHVTEATFEADPTFTLFDLEHALNESAEGLIAANEDYVSRLRTIAAVYRQFDGNDRALEILTRWIIRGERNVAEHGPERMVQQVFGRWNSMGTAGYTGAVATLARFKGVVKTQHRLGRVQGILTGEVAAVQDSEFTSLPKVLPTRGSQVASEPAAVATASEPAQGLPGVVASPVRKTAAQKAAEKAEIIAQQSKLWAESGKAKPEWLQNVAYSLTNHNFYVYPYTSRVGIDAFNLVYRLDAYNDGSVCKSAAQFAIEVVRVPHIAGSVYRPGLPPMIPLPRGGYPVDRCLINTYDTESQPATDEVPTEAGLKMWELINIHLLDGICNRDEEAKKALLDILMWHIARPGERLGQMLVVSGTNGIGKSILTSMVASCYRGGTVTVPYKALLREDSFNTYMNQTVLGVIDELPDSERTSDVFDVLKEYVSSDYVMITAKGVDSGMMQNCQNWIAFTNYPSRIRMAPTERRIMYINSEWASSDAYSRHLQDTYGIQDWGQLLADLIRENPGQILYFAKNHKFSEGFGPDSAPYVSKAKTEIITRIDTGWYGTVLDIIRDPDTVIASAQDNLYRLVTEDYFSINAVAELVISHERLPLSFKRKVETFIIETFLPKAGYAHVKFPEETTPRAQYTVRMPVSGNVPQRMAYRTTLPMPSRKTILAWGKVRKRHVFKTQTQMEDSE